MKLTSAYSLMSPPDMKVLSEPGLPRSISFTVCFEDTAQSCLLHKGESPETVAQTLRALADKLDNMVSTGK